MRNGQPVPVNLKIGRFATKEERAQQCHMVTAHLVAYVVCASSYARTYTNDFTSLDSRRTEVISGKLPAAPPTWLIHTGGTY